MSETKPDEKALRALYNEDTAREDWCAGCGDYGLLRALPAVLTELGIQPSQVVGVPGIGCSGQFFNYMNCNTVKANHGRALPTAFGVKMANKNLHVLVVGGDGDGLAIGMGHFMNVPRANPKIVYVVLDNRTYGLTTGQTSPTTRKGTKTSNHPGGAPEDPANPISSALVAGATFVARVASWDSKGLKEVLKVAMLHEGFAFIDCLSPCVTFNKEDTYEWFKANSEYISAASPDHDRTDKVGALRLSERDGKLLLGIFYQVERPVMEPKEVLVDLPLDPQSVLRSFEQFIF